MAAVGHGLGGLAGPGAVLALVAEAERADGIAPVSEQGVLAVRRETSTATDAERPPGTEPGAEVEEGAGAPSAVEHLWIEDGGVLLGYAQVDDGGSAELVVHPAHRRRGMGRKLLAALPDDVAVWAHGNLPGAQGLARAAGLRVTRELWQMARDLPPGAGAGAGTGPATTAPPGVAVRTFGPGQDEQAWVGLNARAFANHPEQGRLGVEDLRARMAEPWFDPSLLWLAHEAGDPAAVVASMWVKVLPGQDEGEIYALGVDPAAQGRGLGRWLTDLALAEMAARGLARVTLYVDGDNVAAVRTYERAGFARVALDVQYRRQA